MASEPASVAYGLASAASWGAADFSGGLATRRSAVYGVVLFSQGVGLVLLVVLAFAVAEPWPSTRSIAFGAAAGLAGAIGIAALYRALAEGRMGVAAPITGVVAAAIPVAIGGVLEGAPRLLQAAGFGLALLGIAFVAHHGNSGTGGARRGLGLAVVAGAGFGVFYVLFNEVDPGAFLWPLALARVASVAAMVALVVATTRAFVPSRSALALVATAGVLDVGGNAFFLLAAQVGRLDVAAVLSSIYPAFTTLLAVAILKERIERLQAIGILVILLSIPLIAGLAL